MGMLPKATLLAMCLPILLISCAELDEVEFQPVLEKALVSTVKDLVSALNDTTVDHVQFSADAEWKFNADDLPFHAAIISNRTVLMSGENDSPVYIDGNQLIQRTLVTDGGMLIQRNLFVDDCFIDEIPYTCFSETINNGSRVLLDSLTLGDSNCVTIEDSPGISTMAWTVNTISQGTSNVLRLDERTVYFEDSGWIPFTPPGAFWRLHNVNLTCTGSAKPTNTTESQVEAEADEEDDDSLSNAALACIVVFPYLAVIGVIAAVLYLKKKKSDGRQDHGVAVYSKQIDGDSSALEKGDHL